MTDTNANSKIKINLDSLKSRRDTKRHKLKDGHNIYRILPPFGENSQGYPYRKWQVIWGLKDLQNSRVRPFASSMTTAEKACPVKEYVDLLKKKAEDMTFQLKTVGSSDEEIKVTMKNFNQFISDMTPKTVYVYNAVDKAGEVGLLEIKTTAHKKMKEKMLEYINDYNQDPTSLNSEETDSGLWFDITRTGQFRDTEYDVKKQQVKLKTSAGLTFTDDRSPLPDAVVENYANLGYDLSTVYQIKTYAELKEILEANMPDLIELCPEADLGSTSEVEASAPTIVKAPVGTKKVTIKLDDADEEEVEESVPLPAKNTTPAAKKATAVVPASVSNDEWAKEYDAILKS